MVTPKQAAAAAAKGARYMDRHLPGWYRKIDRIGLDLANARMCILGQAAPVVYHLHPELSPLDFDLSSPFSALREYWGLEYRECAPGRRYTLDSLGFYVDDDIIVDVDAAYDLLTDAWDAEIVRRLEADRATH